MADTIEERRSFTQSVIKAVSDRPFTEMMALILSAAIIGYAYYDLNVGRPKLVQQIRDIEIQSRGDYRDMHKYTVDTFNNMMERQEQSHERIVQMLGGPERMPLTNRFPPLEPSKPKGTP